MGIGGLDDQFNAIFRRAFASRVFPPEIVEQLGKIAMKVLSHTINLTFIQAVSTSKVSCCMDHLELVKL